MEDAKHKNLTGERVSNADLYQMLSYATALGLPGGLVIYAQYAQGEADTASYTVRHCGTRLEVAALDLAGTLDEVLKNVGRISKKIVSLRNEARDVGPGIVPNTLSARPGAPRRIRESNPRGQPPSCGRCPRPAGVPRSRLRCQERPSRGQTCRRAVC